MSTTTFPATGRVFADAPKAAVQRSPKARPAAVATPVSATPKTGAWTVFTHFLGDAFAAWASAGRLPH